MRTIVHLSDLHFGRLDARLVEPLLASIRDVSPELIAISGDLTQRARRKQFAEARAFIQSLEHPYLVVPGNHDVPLYDVARRVLRPLHRFRRYVSADRLPVFADAEIAVLGINTARAIAFANGRISREQLAEIGDFFAGVKPGPLRIVVTHHPLTSPPEAPPRPVVHRAARALDGIAAAGIDLILTGHYHQAASDEIAAHGVAPGRSILVSQAGTAISTRLRDEANSYNLIRIAGDEVTCAARSWTATGFATSEERRYRRRAGRWERLESPSPACGRGSG